MTCPSEVFTDKGKFSATSVSHYPPRGDLVPGRQDSADAAMFAKLDVFDAVSRATPPGNEPYNVSGTCRQASADGDYMLHVEASKEGDFNDDYTESRYPSTECLWHEYGVQYRGQPSVIYDVPFTIAPTSTVATTLDYAGYSDLDGILHTPDATISTTTPSSGASRLRVVVMPASCTTSRVTTHPSGDSVAPGSITTPLVEDVTAASATLFVRGPW